MGGLSGEIKGKSKIEVYLEYKEKTEQWEGLFQEMNPDPSYKKLCKSLMVQDPSTGEWILHYHLHT